MGVNNNSLISKIILMLNYKMKLIGAFAFITMASANMNYHWSQFKRDFRKSYNPIEEIKRFTIFKENMEFIKKHNNAFVQGKETYTVGINGFTDLTNDEFVKQHLMETVDTSAPGIRLNYQCPVNFASNGNTAASVDWTSTANPRSTVACTAIKDQASCGSCWSFGTTATFEGAYCLAGKADCTSWTGASEQQLVSCGGKGSDADIGNYYDMGCNGGWIDNGLYYILQQGSISSEADYPYVSGNGRVPSCAIPSGTPLDTISNCGATVKNSEQDLTDAISQIGPIGVAIDASGAVFQLYKSGVYKSNTCSSSRINHAVTAVGFGNDSDGGDYYKVRNSWGTAWGNQGYILMARNYGNMCAIASTPAYAIM